jgi:hypothetical protein
MNLAAAFRMAAGFLLKSGALDSMFSKVGDLSAITTQHVARFIDSMRAVYEWKRAQGDPTATDFKSFFTSYLNGCVRDAIAARPLPAADAANKLVEALAVMADVSPKEWAALLRDPAAWSSGPIAARFAPLGSFLSGALAPVALDMWDAIANDIAAARAWHDQGVN